MSTAGQIHCGAMSPIYKVADDIEMTEYLHKRVFRMADAYYNVCRKPIIVTSGFRSTLRQARAMHENYQLQAGVIYKRKDLEEPVKQAYLTGLDKRWSNDDTIAAMKRVLDEQVATGNYISQHMSGRAADFSLQGLDLVIFEHAAKQTGGEPYLERYCYHVTFVD